MKTLIKDKSKETLAPIFARHETFHPRFGWLKKGFDKAIAIPDVFLSEDASTILGVGKNMVRAIKYWCIAFKVLEEIKNHGQERRIIPTTFGQNLLADSGWDPFLEDPASLWLLHWHLLKPPCHATAWHYTFNIFNKSTFLLDDVKGGLVEFKDTSFPSNRILESSLIKDIACILRMYTDHYSNKAFDEDSVDSPFTELGLIHSYDDSKHYVFDSGPKHNLPSHIIVSACLDYVNTIRETAKTISIYRLAYEAGSPGLSFRLSEGVLAEAVEDLARQYSEIHLTDTAGLLQMSFEGEPKALSGRLLNDYYKKRKHK